VKSPKDNAARTNIETLLARQKAGEKLTAKEYGLLGAFKRLGPRMRTASTAEARIADLERKNEALKKALDVLISAL
jgi:uncharacterized membrane-anchored protein